jgi:hypothetical protein
MNLDNIKIIRPNYVKLIQISDNQYFGDQYSDYISNSKLSLINPDEGGSPEKYNSGLSNNKKYSSAMDFGSAVHQLILQPEEYYLCDSVDKPSGKPALMVDYLLKKKLSLDPENIIKSAKKVDYFHGKLSNEKINEVIQKISAYYQYMINEEFTSDLNKTQIPIYLSSYDRYRCQNCLDSLKKHSQVQKLLYPKDAETFNERTFISEIGVEIPFRRHLINLVKLKFKGKLDNFTVGDKLILNDLKTTGKNITEFAESFSKYHYARQAALYLHFLKFLYPDIKIIEANIIAVQTVPPFTSHVFPISLESISNGIEEASRLIKLVAFYENYGYDECIDNYE